MRAAALIASLALGFTAGCIDFDDAEETCLEIGRCEAPADGGGGEPGVDGGDVDDAGAEDGGELMDAGLSTSCEEGFRLVGEVCSPGGWCWENPWPTGANLHAVDGVGDTAFIAGGAGTLLRQRGCLLEQLPVDTTQDLVSVAAVSEEEAWVSGPGGTVIQHTGMPAAFSYPNGLWVSSVTRYDDGVVAATRVPNGELRAYTALGDAQGAAILGSIPFGVRGLAHELGGGFWALGEDGGVYRSETVSSTLEPISINATGELHDLWLSDNGEAYVVGEGAQAWQSLGGGPFFPLALAEVFDAGTGQRVSLNGVTGTSQGELYIAASGGRLFHYSQGTWSQITRDGAPDALFRDQELRDVWASADAGLVVAVGANGAWLNNADGWRDVHYSARQTRPQPLLDLDGVEGELWAVGAANTALCRRGTAAWTACSAPSGFARTYAAVKVLEPGHVVAAGDSVISELKEDQWTDGTFLSLDGGTVPNDPANTYFIRSIAKGVGDTLWAAGTLGSRGLLLRRDPGGPWREVAFVASTVHEVTVAPTGDVWIAGNDGLLATVDPASGNLTSHHDGGQNFYAVHVDDNSTVYAGGLNYVRRFNEKVQSLNAEVPLPNQQVNDFVATPGGVRMVGAAGTVWNFTGAQPIVEEKPVDQHLFGAYQGADGTVWICGEGGTIIRRDPQ